MSAALALLLAVVGSDAGPPWAYVRVTTADGGVPIAWGTLTVGYILVDAGTDGLAGTQAVNAIRQSFTAWQKENITTCTSQLSFQDLGTTTAATLNKDNRQNNVFFVESNWSNSTDRKGYNNNAIALTTTGFYASGEIVDADLELNSQYFTFLVVDGGNCSALDSRNADLQNTVTHEVGHMIGLDHPQNPDTTMFATAPACETKKRSLHSDDMAGICAIYGTSWAPPASNSGSGGCCWSAIAPGAIPVVSPLVLLLLVGGLVARRRAR